MARVGYLGLGSIGKGICGNLIRKGHEAAVYDIIEAKTNAFEGRAAILAKNEREVFENSDIIFFSLPNSDIVEHVVQIGLDAGLAGKTIVDTSTSYPVSTRELYRKVKEAGGSFVDAPLMAGPAEAEAGTLDIVVGGDREDFDRLADMFACYCRSYKYVGGIGNGHLAKLAINFCGLSQALMFAMVFPVMEKHGVKPGELFDMLNNEALSNWVFHFYSKKYVAKDYHLDFALELGTKDLAYMKKLCEDANVPGFMLDGALDLCRTTLEGQKPGEVLDFSYPCQTVYDLAKGEKA